MTLAPDEFIRRFLLHVLPKGFHRNPSLRIARQCHLQSQYRSIVAHGGVGTLLLCHLSGLPISRDRDQPPTNGGNYFAFDQMTLWLIHGWRSITPLTQA
jgi:hypothetical protein